MTKKTIYQARICSKNKKVFLAFVIVFCLSITPFHVSFASAVQTDEKVVTVDFVYITKNENGGADFQTVRAVDAGNFVLPYAAVQVTFEQPITIEEQSNWESTLRIHNNSSGDDLRHLNEIIADIPVSGRHASFYWRSDMELYYTPEGLAADNSFSIIVPEGWGISNGRETFQTLALNGTNQRFYNIIITDETQWEQMTTTQPVLERVSYIPCVFQDTAENKIYPEAEIRIRGFAQANYPKKSFNIKFSLDQPFTGFQDSSGVYQGPRRSITLWSNGDDFRFITNSVGLKTLRTLEKRILGIEMSPDSYGGFIAINGQFRGPYDILEDPQTGKYGYTTMAAKEKYGFVRNCFLHENHFRGKFYPFLGLVMVPKNEYDYTIGLGNGTETHFTSGIPYHIYVQDSYPPYYPLDFNFEVEADPQDGGKQMDLYAYFEEEMEPPYKYFDILDKETGEWAGYLNRTKVDGYVDVTFPEPVGENEEVQAEFLSLHDFNIFNDTIMADESKMFDWMKLDSVLINIFFCRLTHDRDGIEHNEFFVMRSQDDFETFLDEEGNPKDQYMLIRWDLNHTYGSPLEIVTPTVGDFPLHWTLAEQSSEAQDRYAALFWPELEPGGILTPEFTDQIINKLTSSWGNGLELEGIRWGRRPSPEFISNFIHTQLGDKDFVYTYLLNLENNGYLPSPVAGDMEVLTPGVTPGGELKFQTTFTNLTDQIQKFRYATMVQKSPDKFQQDDFIIPPAVMELAPYETRVVEKRHAVPADMPVGNYVYEGALMDLNPLPVVLDYDNFTFTVLP